MSTKKTVTSAKILLMTSVRIKLGIRCLAHSCVIIASEKFPASYGPAKDVQSTLAKNAESIYC